MVITWKELNQRAHRKKAGSLRKPPSRTPATPRSRWCRVRMIFATIWSRKADFVVRQFCRELLGYSLSRGILLSDKPLLAEMKMQLRNNDYHFTAALERSCAANSFAKYAGNRWQRKSEAQVPCKILCQRPSRRASQPLRLGFGKAEVAFVASVVTVFEEVPQYNSATNTVFVSA
jgi:hypothetical protein